MASALRLAVALPLLACGRVEEAASSTDSGAIGDVVLEVVISDSGADATAEATSPTDAEAGCGLKLCEDFESTMEGDTPSGWTKTGDVSVSSAEFHRGAHALHVGLAPNGPRRIERSLAFLGANAGDHWGRLYFTTADPPKNQSIHSTIVTLLGKSPVDNVDIEARVVDTVLTAYNFHNFQYDVQPSSRAEFAIVSPFSFQYTATWRCVEWHVSYATQSYFFFVDGSEVFGLHTVNGANNFTGTEIPKAYESISVGWNNYEVASNLNGGFEAYIDDLAIDDKRVGCKK